VDRDYFNSSIRSFSTFVEKHYLRDSVVYDVALPRSQDFYRTCIDSRDYVEIYERGLSLSYYNVLLTDLSYFQFSHRSDREWALAYYPNPRISGNSEALRDFEDLKVSYDRGEISDEDYAELLTSFPARMFIPRFRYEYSDEQYEPVRHPIAHFHIGMSGEDRWGVSRKLSPFSFGLLMIKYFYPGVWWKNSRFNLDEKDRDDEEIKRSCLDFILVNSLRRDGVADRMDADEALSFHFSALSGLLTDTNQRLLRR